MTREPSDPGDLELRRMLRDLCDGPLAPVDARARLRIALDLPPPPLPSTPNRSPSVPSNVVRPALERWTSAGRGALGGWIGGVSTITLLGAWLIWSSRPRDFAPPSHQAPSAVDDGRSSEIEQSAAPTAPLPEDTKGSNADKEIRHDSTKIAVDDRGAHGASTTTTERAPRDSSLGAERRLIEAARALLVAGEPAAGLQKIAQHAQQFSHGVLAEEREALSIDALVAARRYEEARRRAERFHARYPGSLFAPSVAAALHSIP